MLVVPLFLVQFPQAILRIVRFLHEDESELQLDCFKELRLEGTLQLDAHRKLPEAVSEVEMAETKLAIAEGDENALVFNACKNRAEVEEPLPQYLSDFRMQTKPRFKAPVHLAAEVAANYQVFFPRWNWNFSTEVLLTRDSLGNLNITKKTGLKAKDKCHCFCHSIASGKQGFQSRVRFAASRNRL